MTSEITRREFLLVAGGAVLAGQTLLLGKPDIARILAKQGPSNGALLIAFPRSATELRLVFSEPIDRASAERPENYATQSGLKILAASVDPGDPRRVLLKTGPMPTWESGPATSLYQRPNDEPVRVEVVRAPGVLTASGAPLARDASPRFIQGIPSVWQIQRPAEERFPFVSRYVNLTAAHTYNPDGGVPHVLVDTLGFTFLHRPTGGPFNSIKIVTKKHISGLIEATARLQPGEGLHVLWAGGQIRTEDGETRLVDTGFMEGAVIAPPLKSPPPYPIRAAEISRAAGKTIRAKSLQGVIVRFENVTIDSVSTPNERRLRHFVFHDTSGARVSGLLLHTVTQGVQPGRRFRAMRGLVHQPRAAEYEVIVELNQHLTQK